MWGLSRGSLDLLVALVANQQDVVTLFFKAKNLFVDLGHQWTGGIDGVLVAGICRLDHRR